MNENEKKVITNKSLKAALKEANEMRKGQIPPEILVEMKKATKDLKAFNFKEKTLQIGDVFPEAILLRS